MDKTLQMSMLIDVYGAALTEKQRDVVDLYYNEDMSLGEIAQNSGITRQGVRDSIKRAEFIMTDLEDKLHIVERDRKTAESFAKIMSKLSVIEEQNEHFFHSPQIRGVIEEIRELLAESEQGE